jgi:hypothetical protein
MVRHPAQEAHDDAQIRHCHLQRHAHVYSALAAHLGVTISTIHYWREGDTIPAIQDTFGTGIGSALFLNGQLVPNTELGHIEIRGKDAERRASDRARQRRRLSWKKWAARVEEYVGKVEALFAPDLLIIGGGVSRKHAKFIPLLSMRTPVVPAQLLNEAGMVGAALAAKAPLRRAAKPNRLPRQWERSIDDRS